MGDGCVLYTMINRWLHVGRMKKAAFLIPKVTIFGFTPTESMRWGFYRKILPTNAKALIDKVNRRYLERGGKRSRHRCCQKYPKRYI